MSRLIVLGAFVAVSMSVPAAAAPGDETKVTKVDKEKKVCRRAVATGSMMPKVTCRTKAEWALISERSQADLQRQRDMERSRSMTGGLNQ